MKDRQCQLINPKKLKSYIPVKCIDLRRTEQQAYANIYPISFGFGHFYLHKFLSVTESRQSPNPKALCDLWEAKHFKVQYQRL